MYHQFYGLREGAFSVTPDPRYLFLSEAHKEALASIAYGVQGRKGFVLVLGEVGTGKTTLIRHILGRLGPDVKTVFVFNPALRFEELLQVVLRDLEIPCQSSRRVDMIDALNEYLLSETGAGRYVVLIIDEAQHLSAGVLEEVRMLSNLETARSKLLQIVLVGQPELGDKLGRPGLRQLRQRIGLVAKLRPLTYKETVRYVAHRLEVSGHKGRRIFTRPAVRKIYRASRGVPRLINVICDKALVLGYGADAKRIKRRLVAQVVKDWSAFGRGAGPSRVAPRARPAAARRIPRRTPVGGKAAALVLALVTATLLLLLATPPEADSLRRLYQTMWRAVTSYLALGKVSAPSIQQQSFAQPVSDTGGSGLLERVPGGMPGGVPAGMEAVVPGLVQGAVSEAPTPQVSEPDASPPAVPRSLATLREVVVKPGDTLSRLTREAYGLADYTMLDLVKSANPSIASIHMIEVGQRLRLPPVRAGSMVYEWNNAQYVVHLGTVTDPGEGGFRPSLASLAKSGHKIRMVPVKLTDDGEVWYRVMVGDFADRERAEAFYRTFGMYFADPQTPRR